MRTRILKVLRDLRADLAKNAMLAAAIAIGVLSVGTTLGAYAVLTREMARNYLGTKPAEATLRVERDITPDLVRRVRDIAGVADAERHATLLGRMRVGENWYPMLFFVIDDFRDMRTNRFTRLSGAWPPPPGTMLIERTARVTMNAGQGGHLVVKTPLGTPQTISISGVVHDPGLAPAWQEQEGYGYVTLDTVRALGERQGFDELRIRLDDRRATTATIEAVARRVADFLQANGHAVRELQIPPPRKHPHQSQMVAILTLFLIFSFATLILSAILVATSLATLMTRQLREIGVMKAIGARSAQIAAMYAGTQAVIAGAATLVGIPLSRHTAALMIERISGLLNLQIADGSIPPWVALVQAASGLLIPLAAAAVPVWRSSAITIREALASYGVSATRFTGGPASRLRLLGQAEALAVRNVFRQRWRLIMSLTLLAAGGALFMTALNVSKAWDANLQKIYRFRHYDVEIRLARPVPAANALASVRRVAGVRAAEGWQRHPVSFTRAVPYDIAHVYPDKGHGSFVIEGVPTGMQLVGFPLLGGRWLRPDDTSAVVLNHWARAQAPDLRIGDRVRLNVSGRVTSWTLVGFVEDLGTPSATAYVPGDVLSRTIGADARTANMIRVALDDRGFAAAFRVSRDLEAALAPRAHVGMSLPMALIRTAIAEHMAVLVSSLLALAILMAVVGGFGLAATTSMNVLERTRELGVMRAIGASPGVIARIVVGEGLGIAAMSFVPALALAAGLSLLMSRLIGDMAFRSPLPLSISGLGIALWLAILVVGSAVATAVPARRASRMTVRDALAYA